MDLKNIDGVKVYIIESLKSPDIRTGENLKDQLRQIWYDQDLHGFDYQYDFVSNSDDLKRTFSNIESEVKSINKFPLIQIECHGSTEGIKLISSEKIDWKVLFDYLRSINIASFNYLFLNLSMCNGESVIRYIDPTKRAPFRAVVGPVGEVLPERLEEGWLNFYKNYAHLSKDYGFCNLAQSSGLIYYNQEFIFDAYFDLSNKDPDLFEFLRKRERYEMYLAGGILAMDPKIHSKWVAEKQAKIKEKYRGYFCFDDLRQIQQEAYHKGTRE